MSNNGDEQLFYRSDGHGLTVVTSRSGHAHSYIGSPDDFQPKPKQFLGNKKRPKTGDQLVDGGDWALDEPDHVPAVWGHGDDVAWAEGEPFMLVGDQGVGKTTLLGQLALHRMGLRPGNFLGMPVKADERPTLYLAMDRPRQAARSLRRMISDTDIDKQRINKYLKVWKGPLPFNPSKEPQRLVEWILEKLPNCGLIIADSVKDFCPAISSDEVGAGLNIAWQGIVANGIELALMHHFKKAQQGSKVNYESLEYVYGSTWLTAGCGSVWNIEGKPGDVVVKLNHAKQPVDVLESFDVQHDHAIGVSKLHRSDDELTIIGAYMDGITAKQFAKRMWDKDEDSDVKKASRRLSKLVISGKVRRIEGTGGNGHGREPGHWTLAPDSTGHLDFK